MGTRTTRWWPDTCGCCLCYDWDDEDPQVPHTFNRADIICEEHQGLEGEALYEAVLAKNRAKNVEETPNG